VVTDRPRPRSDGAPYYPEAARAHPLLPLRTLLWISIMLIGSEARRARYVAGGRRCNVPLCARVYGRMGPPMVPCSVELSEGSPKHPLLDDSNLPLPAH